MSRDEILQSFKRNGHEVLDQKIVELAVDTTVDVANQCNIEMELGKHYLPKIESPKDNKEFTQWANQKPDGLSSENYLRYLCIKGLKDRNKTSKEYRERLDYELGIINQMGFPDYFLIMADIMEFCRNNNVPYGPARGCFTENNEVVLSNGKNKKINEVNLGDIIVGHDEKEHEVINTLEYECDEEITQLEIDNKIIECTNDHEIYAIKKEDWDKGIRKPKWYKANELNEKDYIAEIE